MKRKNLQKLNANISERRLWRQGGPKHTVTAVFRPTFWPLKKEVEQVEAGTWDSWQFQLAALALFVDLAYSAFVYPDDAHSHVQSGGEEEGEGNQLGTRMMSLEEE